MYASFNRFELKITKEQAKIGNHQGECDDDIAYLLTLPQIARQFKKISPADIAAELREYGAWDEVELSDHEANKTRILWIACGNIVANLPTPNKYLFLINKF